MAKCCVEILILDSRQYHVMECALSASRNIFRSQRGVLVMKLETRVFELCNGNYRNLSELAQAMGLSVSQVYRVRESKRSINQKFIIRAKKAFPSSRVNKLADNADTPHANNKRSSPVS